MKIASVDDRSIIFDNGNTIFFDHYQDCCEYNYADFEQLDDLALDFEFDENLDFEAVEGSGFRFGNANKRMFFVPCYSLQNGYYTTEIDIYYNDEMKLGFNASYINNDWE